MTFFFAGAFFFAAGFFGAGFLPEWGPDLGMNNSTLLLGILAGALMSSVAHAAGLNVSSTQLDGSLPTCRS